MQNNSTTTHTEITLNETLIKLKLDSKLNIVFANDYFTEISEYEIFEILGKNIDEIRHPETPKTISNLLWEDLLEQKDTQIIAKFKAKSGAFFWLNVYFKFENGFIYINASKVKSSAKLALNRLYNTLFNIEQIQNLLLQKII